MKCSQCGQAVDLMDKFCNHCGKAVEPDQKRAQVFPRGFEMVCLMTGGVALTAFLLLMQGYRRYFTPAQQLRRWDAS